MEKDVFQNEDCRDTIDKHETIRKHGDEIYQTNDTEHKEKSKIQQLQKDGGGKQLKDITPVSVDHALDDSKLIQTPLEESNEINNSNMSKIENDEDDTIKSRKIPTLEFEWMSYFEKQNKEIKKSSNNTNEIISPVPNQAFAHVEASLDGGVREGMIVEMPYEEKQISRRKEINNQFWLAKVDAVYGPLLKLSYVGCKEPKREIWHDLTQKRLFPLGI